MAQRFYEPVARIFTNAGAVGVGYKYYFYQTGTTTPVTTYQNIGLTVANTNPVLSDANGRFPEIWYSDLSQLKLIVKDSSNNTIETVDPVGATDAAVSLNDFDVRPTSYWGLTAGTSTAFTLIANPTISAYANTQTFVVQVHVDCGDAPTLAIDGLSALNWKKYTQQGTKVVMKANDLRASQRYFCINDGVDVVCLNPNSLPMLAGSNTALTIATGVVTLTNNSSSYVLDTEGAAATDDLDTISGGQDGQIVFITPANGSRIITVKHGTGNLSLTLGKDFSLAATSFIIGLRYNASLALWVQIFSSPVQGALLQVQRSLLTTATSTSAVIPVDNTKPQITEGVEYTTVVFTPKSTSSTIKVTMRANFSKDANDAIVMALFKDSGADALATGVTYNSNSGRIQYTELVYYETNTTLTARTYRMRWGVPTNAGYINMSATASFLFNSTMTSGLEVEEFI